MFLLSSITLSSQIVYHSEDKKAIKKYDEAAREFNARQDEVALEALLFALDRDPDFYEAWELLSHVYFEIGDEDEAIASLYKAVSIDPNYHPENYYFLGEFEKSKGEYEKALGHFNNYLKSGQRHEKRVSKSLAAIPSCEFAIKALENPVPFDPINLGENINTTNPEYLPCLTADDELVLFTRRIVDKRAPEGVQDDLFYSVKNKENQWKEARKLAGVNSVYNEGAASISADGSTLVFTACELYGSYGPERVGYGSCDLFIAYRTTTGWSQPMNLGDAINSANWESQPSISIDGRTIYFIRAPRKRRGDFNQDIYVSERQPDNRWTKATKLSEVVNSPAREETVLIHPDGVTLYFSSNGHPGMGGIDLFMTQKDEEGNWKIPVNLGYPINTINDENSLMVSSGGEFAYFSSNKEGGFGDFDIYSFDLYPEIKPLEVTYVKGFVYDSLTREPIEARFELIDLKSGEKVFNSFSNPKNGEFLIPLPAGKEYALNVNQNGYLFYSDYFALEKNSLPFTLSVPLLPISKGGEVVLKNVFFDNDKFDLKPESQSELSKLILLLTQNPSLSISIEGHTDNNGSDSHNLELSENRAEAVYNYLIENGIEDNRLAFVGYGKTKPLVSNDTDSSRAKNRRTSFRVIAK